MRLAEACIRSDIPLNLHANEEVGGFYPGKAPTPLRDYYRLAARYPELKLILAHWGGGLFFYELLPEVRRALRNVRYDTAASPLQYATRAIFDVALRCVDHRKLLYASDYPLRLYPRRQPEPDFRPFLAEIRALDLAPDVSDDILGGNMARLLGLAGAAGPLASAAAAAETSSPTGRPRSPHPELPAPCTPGAAIVAAMSTLAVAAAWPETRAVFARHGIPCDDSPVAFWEPIGQAAAARGLGPEPLARLVTELNEAAAGSTPVDNGPGPDSR